MTEERTYFCIDMKCFYASVECADRGKNPFETPLVVADKERGRGALCLAISPKMKSLGVKNRCRLFEIPEKIDYIIAKPRMQRYIDCAADIYSMYLDYIDPRDIHVYSIDEAFIDVTGYAELKKMGARGFARFLLDEIGRRERIPASCGIGTNLYLAKIALDITAKKARDGIGFLDEELYRETLWTHRPITDFWQVARGSANRLARYGIYDMRGIAMAPEELLYRTFGVNAELLIDHAWGRESCTMADIHAYRSKSHSVSSSQILEHDYDKETARIVVDEMALAGCHTLMRRHLVTDHVSLFIAYSDDRRPPTSVAARMNERTQVHSILRRYLLELFDKNADARYPIRRLGVGFDDVKDESYEGYDLFTDFEGIRREKHIERTVLSLKDRFGKNAMLRGTDLRDGATTRVRNTLIGGHHE